jgi:hypothetical protein
MRYSAMTVCQEFLCGENTPFLSKHNPHFSSIECMTSGSIDSNAVIRVLEESEQEPLLILYQ